MTEIYQPWFPRDEYLHRVERVQRALRERGLAALLAFQPESVTYLTGFFTRGYGSFQFVVIPAEGEPCLVCRDMERYYLEHTSVFQNPHYWNDSDDKLAVAADVIRHMVGRNEQVGAELGAWQLNAARFEAIRRTLPDLHFEDASDIVLRLRQVKSLTEIAYQRRAARAAEAGMKAAADTARAGISERELAAQVCAAMIRAGSDHPGPGVLSSGERALHLHGGYSDRVLEARDLVQLEVTPCVRHYHARFMRPIRIGGVSDADHRLAETLLEIQDEALAAVRPGVPATVPDAVYRDGVLSRGLAKRYTNKTFYSVGLLLPPSGGEPLEASPGCGWLFEENMVLHTYVLAQGFGFSETIAITADSYECLTRFPRSLIA